MTTALLEIRRRKELWYALVITFISLGVAVGVNIWYTQRYADESAQKWCQIVKTMDTAYQTPRPPGSPPLTATGRELAQQMHKLRSDLKCK